MADRFIGFRYELTPTFSNDEDADLKFAIRDKADALFCFGWVQESNNERTIVGEARCKKKAGHEMQSFLISIAAEQDGTDTKQIKFRLYDEARIRLHFSNFKVVSPRRNTCFREEPHKCNYLYFEAEDSMSSAIYHNE